MSLKVCWRLIPLTIKNVSPIKPLLINNAVHLKNLRMFATAPKIDTKQKSDIKNVYYGMLTPQIKAVKFFSLSSSFVGIIAQPFLYKELTATGNTAIIIGAYSFIGFFTFVTPLLLHFITKKYVTHLDYNEKTGHYIAKTVNFFCVTKENEFKVEDVVVPDVPGMFTTLEAKGKSFFFDPRQFEDPNHYAKLMGYDKPIDFKMYETPPDVAKKTK